jgi:thioredoxin reductase (NADPH)
MTDIATTIPQASDSSSAYATGGVDPTVPTDSSYAIAFPKLDAGDLAALKKLATACSFADGEIVFRAGDADLDLFVVESGGIEIINPSDGNRHIVTHGPGQFAGDIDLLTRRPVIVTGIARGATKLMRVEGPRLREILNRVPHLGEKMLIAAMERRRLLTSAGVLGLKVVGPGKCRDTMRVREFLFKNFVPFTWYESSSDAGKKLLEGWGSPKKSPVVELTGGKLLINCDLRSLAKGAGVWKYVANDVVDLAIVGGGPAGMTAAVYAASEGVSTIVIDGLGPGGQAAGSSKIENFIGFPSGLSGAELAMRSVVQMLKFGAKIVAPVLVEKITPAASADEYHLLQLDCGTNLRARTVLVSAGVKWRKLEAEGAERFESAGIHYACTSVEAVLYDTQDVAVVGAGNSAGQAAMFLAECCRDRTVHLLVRKKLGPGMSEYLVGRIRATPNIKVHEGVVVSAVHGERRLESVTLRKADGGAEGTSGAGSNWAGANGAASSAGSVNAATTASAADTTNLPISAAFVFIGADPGCGWLPSTMARDGLGYILTGADALASGKWPLKDREPCPLETTVPGILAAGDIRAGSTKRVGFAVGDGSLAVTCVHKLTAIRK